MRLPDFIIIGAPRSGTTYLSRNLSEHPQIYVAIPGEDYSTGDMHFFDINQPEGRENYDKGLTWYGKQFETTEKCEMVGEKTADYLADQDTPRLIHDHVGGKIKLIVTLRNPVLRAYSHYLHLRPNMVMRANFNSVFGGTREGNKIIQSGFYYRNLMRYLEYFSMKNIHVMVYEELFKNPQQHFRDLFHYLQVNEDFTPPYLNRSINRSQSSGPVYYLGLIAGTLKRTAPGFFNVIRNASILNVFKNAVKKKRGLNFEGNNGSGGATVSRDTLDECMYEKLYETYSEDIILLSKLIGKDLSEIWGRKGRVSG